jgi:uncharacterized membrane protein
MTVVRARQAIAVLALAGATVSSYLLLYRWGIVGRLACAVEGCEVVQASRYAWFLGWPVAGWGLLGYATLLALAAAGAHPRWADDRRLSATLAALAAAGFAFSTYLTALELFVIRAICFWCVVSYAIIAAIFGLALWAWARHRRERAATRSAAPAASGPPAHERAG